MKLELNELTTKAAKCPKCQKYHLIASLNSFHSDKEVRKDFAEMMIEGFNIIEVTTQQARDGFGYCEFPEEATKQTILPL